MTIETVIYTLPEHWLVAFFNDDLTAYDDEEIDQLEHFTHYMIKTHGSAIPLDCDMDTVNFTQWHDATSFGVLACNVVDVIFEHNPQQRQHKGN